MACCMMINAIEEGQTMPITDKSIFTAALDFDPDKEAVHEFQSALYRPAA